MAATTTDKWTAFVGAVGARILAAGVDPMKELRSNPVSRTLSVTTVPGNKLRRWRVQVPAQVLRERSTDDLAGEFVAKWSAQCIADRASEAERLSGGQAAS